MCRIAGIIDPTRSLESISEDIKRMCQILAHGGPDGEGIYESREHHMVLGHRRLSLLDLSEAGKQPMTYDSERFVITYNGEIYNYPELKTELEGKGYSFKTVCDTEMILVAFKEWGSNCFKKFEGMFAFGLLDKKEQQFYLVRDESGVKPLYFYQKDKMLLFSSEIKALKIIDKLNVENKKSRILLLAYGHLPEPETPLEEVKMIAKGTYIQFDLMTGKCINNIFNSFQFSESILSREKATGLVRSSLRNSVRKHLLSDAPIGVFLSGGIDSSILAILAHEFTGNNLNTLSLYFKELQYSEKKYQDIIINQLQCKNEQFQLTADEFSNHLEDVINDMDAPSTDGINTWFISKAAKQAGLKAVLSGVGSDELFGGYPSFKRMEMINYLKASIPSKMFRTTMFKTILKFKRAVYLDLDGIKGKYLFLRGHYVPSEISYVLDMDEREVWEILRTCPIFPRIDSLSAGNQASWMEMNMYMQNQLIKDSDVMSMAHGIEIRVPFLDKHLISTALRIKSSVKFTGKHPKQLLIDAHKKILPEPIWNRKKMGFTFPFKEWLNKNPLLESVVAGNARYQRIYHQFLENKIPWSQVMGILVLEKTYNE